MAATAVFLGAGASRAFGYPVTASLLPMILSRLEERAFDKGTGDREEQRRAKEKRALLLRLIHAVGPGLGPPFQNGSIGEVLSLADYSLRASNALVPGLLVEDLTRCRSLLEEAIIEVLAAPSLEESSPGLLQRTARWLRELAESEPTAVVSTNYDTGLDFEFLAGCRRDAEGFARDVDLGFSWRECASGRVRHRPPRPRMRLFKLHGSLNWVRCELCEHVYVNPCERNLASFVGYGEIRDWNTCHCSHAPLRALLVAPSTVRDVRDTSLLEVWKSTLEFLRHAREWILIGYSLPSEDIGIRSLLVRASLAREGPRPRVRVVQRRSGDAAQDRDTEQRYRSLFPDCEYSLEGIERFVDEIVPLAPESRARTGDRHVPRPPQAPDSVRPGANPA